MIRKLLFVILLTVFMGIGSCKLTGGGITGATYLLPTKMTGGVAVFFDQPDGIVPEIENGTYIYKIPESGVLMVKDSAPKSIVSRHYFYADEHTGRTEIQYLNITGRQDPDGQPQSKFGNISPNDYENRIYEFYRRHS